MLCHFLIMSVNIISEVQLSIAVHPGCEIADKDRYGLLQRYIFSLPLFIALQ